MLQWLWCAYCGVGFCVWSSVVDTGKVGSYSRIENYRFVVVSCMMYDGYSCFDRIKILCSVSRVGRVRSELSCVGIIHYSA